MVQNVPWLSGDVFYWLKYLCLMNPMFMAEAESEPMAGSDPYTLWALQERQKQKKKPS